MLFQNLEKYYYIVYVDSSVLTIKLKKIIDILLHIR